MLEMLKNWYSRRLSDPQAMGLLAILLFGFIAIYFFSDLIAPLLIAIVLAYLLEMPINFLTKKLKFPRMLATLVIFGGFITLALLIFFGLVPTLWNQTISLLSDLPAMFNKLHEWLLALPEHYPELIDYTMIDTFFSAARAKILGYGESAVKLSISSLMNLVSLGIYAFLVPLMMFFMLKDKSELLAGVSRFLPKNRILASRVWNEMQTYIIFLSFGLNYPLLLSVAVGLSVLVPYIGAVLVTIPVALVAMFQFGISPTFWYLIVAFAVSQLLDGNLLVPYLFSEVVNLHPLVIIISVLIFGGLWGFWGVFFAIPLATESQLFCSFNFWISRISTQSVVPALIRHLILNSYRLIP
ncbi:MAG: AI-2E family transporter [Haemophilus parainfluenzae]|nr:AI-2E family transporter [Haemophilus parainfluenzae]